MSRPKRSLTVSGIGVASAFLTTFDFVYNKADLSQDERQKELLNKFLEVQDTLLEIKGQINELGRLIEEQGVSVNWYWEKTDSQAPLTDFKKIARFM